MFTLVLGSVSVYTHAHLCSTLCNPMNHSPPGSSVHGICQARILEWVAISFSGGNLLDPGRVFLSAVPLTPLTGLSDLTVSTTTYISCISRIGRQILYHWTTWEAQTQSDLTLNPSSEERKELEEAASLNVTAMDTLA